MRYITLLSQLRDEAYDFIIDFRLFKLSCVRFFESSICKNFKLFFKSHRGHCLFFVEILKNASLLLSSLATKRAIN